jgi:hypothetical protein
VSVKYIGDERVRILTAKFPEGYRRAIHITAVVCAHTPRRLCMMSLLKLATTKNTRIQHGGDASAQARRARQEGVQAPLQNVGMQLAAE